MPSIEGSDVELDEAFAVIGPWRGCIREARRDHEAALAADPHAREALVPARDHGTRAEAERVRLAAVGALEHGPVLQGADVVHGDDVARHRGRARADGEILRRERGLGAGGIIAQTTM